jgi:hypothetical protein
VACAELTGQPLCLLSLDFWAAFEHISFSYVLRAQGYDDQILRVIKSIYEDVKSKIIINGHCWGPGDFPNRKQDFTYALCSLLSAIIKIAELLAGT